VDIIISGSEAELEALAQGEPVNAELVRKAAERALAHKKANRPHPQAAEISAVVSRANMSASAAGWRGGEPTAPYVAADILQDAVALDARLSEPADSYEFNSLVGYAKARGC